MRREARASTVRQWSFRRRGRVQGAWAPPSPWASPASAAKCPVCGATLTLGYGGAFHSTTRQAWNRIDPRRVSTSHVFTTGRSGAFSPGGSGTKPAPDEPWAEVQPKGQSRLPRAGRTLSGCPHTTPRRSTRSGRLQDAVICVACRGSSGLDWRGWLAYRVEDPENVDPPELGFYCPTCAARDLGRRPRRV